MTTARRLLTRFAGWFATCLLLAIALFSNPAIAQDENSHEVSARQAPTEEHDNLNSDPVGSDAAEMSKDLGISPEEARAAIDLQPEIGRMEADLERTLPASYGGALMEYQPEYGVTVLVTPGHTERVRAAIERRGFGHLTRHITFRETPYTRPALLRAVDRVKQIAEEEVTSTDIDLRAGVVEVTAATDEDAVFIREAVNEHRSSIEAERVLVIQSNGGGEESESYGGLQMSQSDGTSPCTSGFSVRRTTDDAYGVTTAAHCKNSGYYLHQVLLDYITGLLWR